MVIINLNQGGNSLLDSLTLSQLWYYYCQFSWELTTRIWFIYVLLIIIAPTTVYLLKNKERLSKLWIMKKEDGQ